MRICGIDPGMKGAIAFADVSPGKVSDGIVYDMPMTDLKDGDKKDDSPKMTPDACAIRRIIMAESPSFVVLEKAFIMGRQGHMFRLGVNFGELRAAVRSSFDDARTFQVLPKVWKDAMGLTEDKQLSLDMAREAFPDLAHMMTAKTAHDGRAEALLLCKYYADHLIYQVDKGIEVY